MKAGPYKPFFTTRHGKYWLEDAERLLPTLPSQSVDAVITDPPFGLGTDRYDDGEVFFRLEDELYRVLKRDAWLVFYYTVKKLGEAFRLKKFKYVWMIVAHFPTSLAKSQFGDRKYLPVFVFRKGEPKVCLRFSDVVYAGELPMITGKVGDMQFKPTASTASLIAMFTKPGDLVLDPFAGYGSIPLVCETFRRRWWACDIDPEKASIAREFIVEGRTVDIKSYREGRKAPTLESWVGLYKAVN